MEIERVIEFEGQKKKPKPRKKKKATKQTPLTDQDVIRQAYAALLMKDMEKEFGVVSEQQQEEAAQINKSPYVYRQHIKLDDFTEAQQMFILTEALKIAYDEFCKKSPHKPRHILFSWDLATHLLLGTHPVKEIMGCEVLIDSPNPYNPFDSWFEFQV